MQFIPGNRGPVSGVAKVLSAMIRSSQVSYLFSVFLMVSIRIPAKGAQFCWQDVKMENWIVLCF